MAWQVTPLMQVRGTTDTTPQPAWGSWVASVSSGNFTVPASSPLTLTLGNACASGNDAAQLFTQFVGQYAYLIDPGVSFAGANSEKVFIKSVSANTITLGSKPLKSASSPGGGSISPVTEYGHVAGAVGTGTYIIPAFDFNNTVVTLEDGGTGVWFYLGNSISMTTTTHRIWKLAQSASGSVPSFYNSGMFSPGNPFNMQELWVLGTAGDQWTVSCNVD